MYDNFGHAGVDPNAQAGDPFGGFGGFSGFHVHQQSGVNINMEDLSEMFEAAFGGRMNTKRGRDVQIGIKLSFLEAVNGCTKDVEVAYIERSGPRDRGTQKQKSVNISIPAGVESGMQMRVQGKGTPGQSGHKSGDLLVEVDVEEDPYFKRDGSDLHVEIPVAFTQVS
jgi:molecular chaperone DnaJ